MGISIWQLLIILVIVVLLFGTKKLRNMGGDLGSAIKNFKSSMGDGEAETRSGGDKKDDGKLIEQEPEDVETQKKQDKDSSRNE